MGRNLFGANISGKIARSLGPKLPLLTLRKLVQGARTSSNLAAGRESTTTDHTFRGVMIGLEGLRKETILPDTKNAVLILAETVKPLVEPTINDKVLEGSTVYTISSVGSDPDKATFTCQLK